MKKIAFIIILVLFFTSINPGNYSVFAYNNSEMNNSNAVQESIAKKVIRFHVLANSDTEEDQNLKLRIRDKVLEYIAPKLKNSSSINESRKILKENNLKIKKIAENVIKNSGYSYSIKTELTNMNFPVKTYGNIVLPQGEYEAYRILIGKGEGHNWWCVMFPPLCFVDITKGQIAEKKTEDEMKRALTKEEYQLVYKSKDKDRIVVKSKIAEEIQSFIKWLNSISNSEKQRK